MVAVSVFVLKSIVDRKMLMHHIVNNILSLEFNQIAFELLYK